MPCEGLFWSPSGGLIERVEGWVSLLEETASKKPWFKPYPGSCLKAAKLAECAFSFHSGLPVNWEIYDTKGDGGLDFDSSVGSIGVCYRSKAWYELVTKNHRLDSLTADFEVLITPKSDDQGDLSPDFQFWLRGYASQRMFRKWCQKCDFGCKDTFGKTHRYKMETQRLQPVMRLIRKIKNAK